MNFAVTSVAKSTSNMQKVLCAAALTREIRVFALSVYHHHPFVIVFGLSQILRYSNTTYEYVPVDISWMRVKPSTSASHTCTVYAVCDLEKMFMLL